MYKDLMDKFSRKAVMDRMIDQAVKQWKIKEHEYDALDPAVKLLFEACSVEVEKLASELADSNKRILEQMARLFAPGHERPTPATSVLYARPGVDAITVDANTEFECSSDDVNPGRGNRPVNIRFAPLMEHQLYNGKVKYLAHQKSLFEIDTTAFKKKKLFEASSIDRINPHSIWLGIELDSEIEYLEGLVLFLDWLTEMDLELKKSSLSGLKVYLNDQEIPYEFGLFQSKQQAYNFRELAMFQEMEEHLEKIHRKYYQQFVSLMAEIATFDLADTPGKLHHTQRLLPDFADEIKVEDKCQLLWMELRLPTVPPTRFLSQFTCSINCFPVINRSQQRITYRTNKVVNIVPLQSDDELFLAIDSVMNASNKHYYQTPPSSGTKAGQYAIQYQSNRFDDRDAGIILQQLKDRLYEDANRFNAMGIPFIRSFVDDLHALTARLEERLNASGYAEVSNQPYLIIWPENPGEFIYVAYWNTVGQRANDIVAGTQLTPYGSSKILSDQCVLLKKSWGGKNSIGEEGELFAFKQAILDKGHYLTEQRMRSICRAHLGSFASAIKINKKLSVSGSSGGLLRIYSVNVYFPAAMMENDEIKDKLRMVQLELEKYCAYNEEIEVKMLEN